MGERRDERNSALQAAEGADEPDDPTPCIKEGDAKGLRGRTTPYGRPDKSPVELRVPPIPDPSMTFTLTQGPEVGPVSLETPPPSGRRAEWSGSLAVAVFPLHGVSPSISEATRARVGNRLWFFRQHKRIGYRHLGLLDSR